jgi:hypothetical protein
MFYFRSHGRDALGKPTASVGGQQRAAFGAARVRTECDTTAELDMKTLIWTRGANFPLKLLESRLRCPQCGKLGVTVLFAVPGQPKCQVIRAAE